MLALAFPPAPLPAADHVLSWFAGAQHANIDGPVADARFDNPAGLAIDQSNNLYVADSGNHTIRRISPDGRVTTLAGQPGESGIQDGFASGARFASPACLAVDRDGVVYVCSTLGKRVQSITPNGVVKTVADEPPLFSGNLANLAVDRSRNLYLAFDWPGVVRKRTAAGAISTYMGASSSTYEQGTAYPQSLFQPTALAIDLEDNLYVNSGSTTIVKVSAAGVSSLFVNNAGGGPSFILPRGLALDRAGNGYLADTSNGLVRKITADGKTSIFAGVLRSPGYKDGPRESAQFVFPQGVAVDDKDNVFVTDSVFDVIRKIAPDGQVTTYAGSPFRSQDGSVEIARFDAPNHVVTDGHGNLLVAQAGQVVRKVDSRGTVSTVAGVATESGNIDGSAGSARFGLIEGLAIANDGALFVSDRTAKTVRKVSPAGVVTTLAGSAGSSGSKDGIGTSASFISPGRLAVDVAGNIYVADEWVIRKITPNGTVTTLAGTAAQTGTADGTGPDARFRGIGGLAVDHSGNLLVADRSACTIRKVSPTGTVTTLAGLAEQYGDVDGKGSAARLSSPGALAVDASDNIYVVTQTTLKKIGPDGSVSTFAKIGVPHEVSNMGLAIDDSGDLYLSGPKNAIWKISAPKAPPIITSHPQSAASAMGGNLSLSLSVAASGTSRIQWWHNGTAIPGATTSLLALNDLRPEETGLYAAIATNDDASGTTTAAIIGLTATAKAVGAGDIVGSDIQHPNGNIFDQVLLTGAAAAITADYDQNQITRTSFIDLDNDIVQVEFSGPGTLSLVLDTPSGPAAPEYYNQATAYMKGHAGIVITGADERSNVSVFSVGRKTAVNQALFKDGVNYDGIADLAFIAIASTNGRFGGVRTANANYFAAKGLTGVYAPGVAFAGPVFIGNLSAYDNATPVILLGSAGDTRITGGDMLQANSRAVEVSGLTQLQFKAGSDSHGKDLPAQTNHAVYRQDGVDVTSQIVVNPPP